MAKEDGEKKDKHEVTEEEKAKFIAETRKVEAETARIQLDLEAAAEIRALNLELVQAQVQQQQAFARSASNNERMSAIGAASVEREEQERLASDEYNHVYRFNAEVNDITVRYCMQRLALWTRTDPTCKIEIIFSSPGGSVISGNVLFDYIIELREKGHEITTSTMGMAASMAGILLQAGTTREMHRHAWVLIHEITSFAVGKVGEMEDELQFIKRLQEKALDIFAVRCAEAKVNGTAKHPLTRNQIARHWKRKDWWVSAEECLDYGLVDRLRG